MNSSRKMSQLRDSGTPHSMTNKQRDMPNYLSNNQSTILCTNMDFSGFPTVLETSYAALKSVDNRIERLLPFCVYQHVNISRLNAQLINFLQTKSGENRHTDESLPYTISNSEDMITKFHAPVYYYLSGIANSITPAGHYIKANVPWDAVPKLGSPQKIDPGHFGPLNATTHNIYECYASPLVSRKFIENCRNMEPNQDWNPLPPSYVPDLKNGVHFNENCIGYKKTQYIPTDILKDVNSITFETDNNLSGRLAFSYDAERMVNTYLNSVADKIIVEDGFPEIKPNNSLCAYVTAKGEFGEDTRIGDIVTRVNSFFSRIEPINYKSGLLVLRRERAREASGICLTGLPPDQIALYTETRNSNFEMKKPFSKTRESSKCATFLNQGYFSV